MKKKVALLLVLVMIVTSLPLMVFGAAPPANTMLPGVTVSGHFHERNENQTITLRLPINALLPEMGRVVSANDIVISPLNTFPLVVDLRHAQFQTGFEVGDEIPSSVTADARVTANDGTIVPLSPEAFTVTLAVLDRDGANHDRATLVITLNPAYVELFGADQLVSAIGGLEILLPLRSRDHGDWVNSNISAWNALVGAPDSAVGRFVTQRPLSAYAGVGVVITAEPTARPFQSQLAVGGIRVREVRIGDMPSQVTLRLEAPSFYTWSFNAPAGVTPAGNRSPIPHNQLGTVHTLNVTRSGSIIDPAIVGIYSRSVDARADRPHFLYITVDLGRSNVPLGGGGWFQINNLFLIPDGNAPTTGDVHINATIGLRTGATGGTVAIPPQLPQEIWAYRWEVDVDGTMTNANYLRANDTLVTFIVDGEEVDAIVMPNANRGAIVENARLFALAGGDVNPLAPSGEARALPAGVNFDNLAAWTNPTQRAQFAWVIPTVVNGVETTIPVAHTHPEAELVLVLEAHTRTQYPFASFVPYRIIGWTSGHPGHPGTTGTDAGFTAFSHISGYSQRLHVGVRGLAALTANVYFGPYDQYMRTGHLGTFRPTSTAGLGDTDTILNVPNVSRNQHNNGLAHYTGVVTGTLIIDENVPGAFATGFASPIHFEFLDDDGNPHPGIRLLGVQARAGTNDRTNDRTREHGEGHNFRGGHRNNWMTFNGWLSALENRLPVASNVGRITDQGVSIYMPHQQLSNVAALAALEIRFFLSLEAGYEWKYGEGVYVTLSGPGIYNLPAAQRRVRIGTAVDPIQVRNVTSLSVDTGTLYNILGRQPIDDLVIDVINNNAFNIGDELWIYVTSDVLARSADLSLSGIPTLTVADSALRFGPGNLVTPQFGRTGRSAVVFTVIRQPNANEEPVLTISNLAVEGQVFPGVDYQIVVSGTAVAYNDQEIFHSLHQSTAFGTQIRSMNRGVFTSLPYYQSVVYNDGEGRWDGAPGSGLPGAQGRLLRVWEGMPAVANVSVPFYWEMVGPNRVGMISLAVFAEEFLGTTPVWDSAARTGSIQGLDVNGNQVAVSFTIGSTSINISTNGGYETVDIADFVQGLSGPSGTVRPTILDGRAYLPLRFIANAFGLNVSHEGAVVTIS